jgi:hypothetical protein
MKTVQLKAMCLSGMVRLEEAALTLGKCSQPNQGWKWFLWLGYRTSANFMIFYMNVSVFLERASIFVLFVLFSKLDITLKDRKSYFSQVYSENQEQKLEHKDLENLQYNQKSQ